MFSITEKYNLQNLVTVKSYNYNHLLLGYGPNKEVNVNIFWCTEAMEFKMVSWQEVFLIKAKLCFFFPLNSRSLQVAIRQ